ncbi:MAG: HAD-IB family hydrolase [Candidatus Nanopelagicales bacterium]|nr:HAD-IB family hydrolase [Candidatus Nanopelagicales bacterium]
MPRAEMVDTEPTQAAFFDVDNTLLRGSSIYYMARGLITRRIFTPRQVAEMLYRQTRFVVTGAEKATDLATMVAGAQELVRGRPVEQVVGFGEMIFETQLVGRLWPESLDLIREHLAAGREVWLVTSTGQEIADMIAAHLGLTGAIGTRSEIVDGHYTGRLAGAVMHGPAKGVAVSELADLRSIDLAESYAYSDSANDIPMLSLVGHPVAVNPDRPLRRWAVDHDAAVLDFADPSRIGRALTTVRKTEFSRTRWPRIRFPRIR